MYLENLTALVRGDNTLLSHSEPSNDFQAGNLKPFARALPSSLYERAWGPLHDEIWYDEMLQLWFTNTNAPGPNWLQQQLLSSLGETTSTPAQRIATLQAGLQTITSLAYRLLSQHFLVRINGSLTFLNATGDVQGQQQILLARLHVNGSQTVLGLLCVITLFLCVLYAAKVRDGLMSREDSEYYTIVGNVLDFMCLMRGSSLPELFAKPTHDLLAPDARRDKAEEIGVV
jgi:hypothetical protein